MNSCGGAFGVVDGGGGNERFGVIFKNVLNATCILATIHLIPVFIDVESMNVGYRSREGGTYL